MGLLAHLRPLTRLATRTNSTMAMPMLKGVKVVELAGLAPVPHCGLMLADFGAHVTCVEKAGGGDFVEQRLNRGKTMIQADLKSKDDLHKIKQMCLSTDVLLDPYRPGVLEKLGLDPVKLIQENRGLIVCRLTGWGQTGPMAHQAGHDINYVALTGLLPTVAGHNRSPPWPPANLLADFAGGGLTAAFGIATALFNRTQNGGNGCVIDCAMIDGLSYLGSFITQYKDQDPLWNDPYAAFSGDFPVYRCYETSDGKFMSVGALEPKFNQAVFEILGLPYSMGDLYSQPAEIAVEMEKIFKTKTRDEWTKLFEGKNACVAPVLDMHEVGDDIHHQQRNSFTKEGTKWVPAPAPRFYTADEFAELREKEKAKL